jgi:hypothetical protein
LSASQTLSGTNAYTELRAYRCTFCDRAIIALYEFPEIEAGAMPQIRIGDVPTEVRVLYPSVDTPKLPPEVPRRVASLWEEAAVCANAGALRGAAGCLRGAVEQIAKDHNAEGNDLHTKINELGTKTSLDADLIEGLHDTRLTGNWSLHDGIEFSADEVADLSGLVADAVEILYVQPAKRKAMAAQRAARRTK